MKKPDEGFKRGFYAIPSDAEARALSDLALSELLGKYPPDSVQHRFYLREAERRQQLAAWYQRPWGILVLSVAAALIGAYVSHALGWTT